MVNTTQTLVRVAVVGTRASGRMTEDEKKKKKKNRQVTPVPAAVQENHGPPADFGNYNRLPATSKIQRHLSVSSILSAAQPHSEPDISEPLHSLLPSYPHSSWASAAATQTPS